MKWLVLILLATTTAHADAIEIAWPSLDTGRGIDGGYEHWFPAQRMSMILRGELREAASGDYTGIRLGVGAEADYFWRANRGAWLSVMPEGFPVGWFVGVGVYLAGDATHDDEDHRWLGTTTELGLAGRIGYRIAPWRGLLITPSVGLEGQRDIDLSGRLDGANRFGLTVGLDFGWWF
ncbi:MAG: hypothetical protein QM831_01235 [Kofleriaceae bacterium]